MSDCYLQNLNILQKWILKVIYEKHIRYPSDLLFKETEIYDIRQLFCLSLLMSIHNNKIKLDTITHQYTTRSKERCVAIPRTQKTIGQRCAHYIAPRLFNIVPETLRNLVKAKTFKIKIKIWITRTDRKVLNDIVNHK